MMQPDPHDSPADNAPNTQVAGYDQPCSSHADVTTSRPGRYIKQLVSHFGNKITTKATDTGGELEFDFGQCHLAATKTGIRLVASAPSQSQLATVQDVVGRHLERFGAADGLVVTWSAG